MADIEENGRAVEFSEQLEESQARGEFVFLGLRCLDGFEAREFERRFRSDFEAAFPHASELQRDGLLRFRDGRWALTERGLLLGDSVFATFV
jgi:oxygen-independent coproporphyrinogen-3 oxidase